MNWIIKESKKFEFHTYLDEILKPIVEDLNDYNWFLSDLEFCGDQRLPINYDKDFFILSFSDFNKILEGNVQFIWGVILAIPKNIKVDFNEEDLPFVERNDLIWENNNFQIKNSVLEINAFDSSLTIIKFSDINLSNKFKNYFQDDAIVLSEF